jgi:predicted signal transduction protein with EAL and GGDEF domain
MEAVSRPSGVNENPPQPGVTLMLRGLEPWVALSIGAYAAMLALLVFPGTLSLWLFGLLAVVIGQWASWRPAHSQHEMVLRAAALLAGACLMHSQVAGEGGAGTHLFVLTLGVICLFYALMLKPVWGATIGALALLAFTATALLDGGAALTETFVQAAYLCVFPSLLAMKFGVAMRRADEALESGRIDAPTSLYNKAGFLAHGEEMLAASRRERRSMSVAVFDCADLIEVRSIYGSRIARKLTERIVRKLSGISAGRGFAARTGPAEFTVVVWGGREKALKAIERALGNPMRIELDAGDSEIVLVPWFQVEAAGADVANVEDLYLDLRRDIADMASREQRHQNHVQRERERHSRPMGVQAVPALAPTLPAPLVIS